MSSASDPASEAPTPPPVRPTRHQLNPFSYNSAGDFLWFCLFLGGFVAVVAYFNFVDVYDNHYLQRGLGGIYNAFRVVFIVYLFWLICFTGHKILVFGVGDRPVADIQLHERLALGFFVGAAALTIAMLVLGYAYLYWRSVAALIAASIIAVSYRDFVRVLQEARSSVARYVRNSSRVDTALTTAMAIGVLFAGAILLLVKGLYPQGGHDYYLHYSQFYSMVIDSHGIWPNAFWYQYYYSKGVGLMFLSMLLTDPLAPSLVTYCFVIATALALYSLIRRICPQTLWPWVAVILYLALDVHTVGTGIYAANGGWGHFQKAHEINTAFLIAILWLSTNMVRSAGDARLVWWLGAAACCFVVAYLLIISSAVVGLFCLLAATGFFIVDRSVAKAFFGLAVVAGLGLVSVLALNYLTTGMPSDIGVNTWWPIIDFQRLSDDGTLFDVVNTAFRRSQPVDSPLSFFGPDMAEFVTNVSRFDLLGIFMWGALAGVVVWLAGRAVFPLRFASYDVGIGASNIVACCILLAFLASIAIFTFTAGAMEPVSYVRISSFSLPLMVAVAAVVWQIAILSAKWPSGIRVFFAYAVPILLTCMSLAQAYANQKATLLPVLTNALRFAGGQYSIYDAYRDQSGWPALPDSRAIYPGMYEAWKSVGPGKRIWSFNVHSYCMAPGCRVESHLSSKMSAQRADILFGSADTAKTALQRDGLNYFFISTYLDIRDPLICTPLFSPDTIAQHFGVQWTNGTDVLLTWKGPATKLLSAAWIDKYRTTLKASPYTPSCVGNGPAFSYFGRRVHDEVVKGKRWGAEIAQPK
jgi:hypothetical protein